MVLLGMGAGLQNPCVYGLQDLEPGSVSTTETRLPRFPEGAAAGADNGGYKPRARVPARVGIVTPALLTYHRLQVI